MNNPVRCASCGQPVDPPGPDGPCPVCLLKKGLQASAGTGAEDLTLRFEADEPPWASGALTAGDWLCTFGCQKGSKNLAVPCRLAHVPLSRALDRGAWRFYAGGSWSANWRVATPVIDDFYQLSVAWNGYLGKYVVVGTRLISSLIFVRSADRPEGPWSEDVIVEGIPSVGVFPWIHSAVAHAELARDGGRRELLTYNRSFEMAGGETRAVEIEFRMR